MSMGLLLFALLSTASATWLEFDWRVRLVNATKEMNVSYSFDTGVGVKTVGDAWSETSNFTEAMGTWWQERAPNSEIHWSVLYTGLGMSGNFPSNGEWLELQIELTPSPESTQPHFKPTTLSILLGQLVSSDTKRGVELFIGKAPTSAGGLPPVQTSGTFNYNAYFASLVPLGKPRYKPTLFPIVDEFRCSTDEVFAFTSAVEYLGWSGVNALQAAATKQVYEIFKKGGMPMTSGAVYEPPLGLNDYVMNGSDAEVRAELQAWANKTLNGTLEAGWKAGEVQAFAIADEPGWYYPSTWEGHFSTNARAIARFTAYLEANGLTPESVGAKSWTDVHPLGRGGALKSGSIEALRLYYYTMRFFSWDSARYLNEVAATIGMALGAPSRPDCIVQNASMTPSTRCVSAFSNYNDFSSRLVSPGPWARNPDPSSPDTGFASEDWLQAAASASIRPAGKYPPAEGALSVHTEDWFGDWQAYQWSFIAARLREGSRKGGSVFGGYIVGRVCAASYIMHLREMSLVAGGAGYIRRYNFGPEYTFPGNTNSQGISNRWAGYRQTGEVVGFAEKTLLSGRPRPSPVRVVFHRSPMMWDSWNLTEPTDVRDITQWDEFSRTPYWAGEAYGLYFAAAITAGVPVDMIDEDDLTEKGLEGTSVVLATAPEIPVPNRDALLQWITEGGSLIATVGTGRNGRYGRKANDSKTLWGELGVEEVGQIERNSIIYDIKSYFFAANVTIPYARGVNASGLGPIQTLLHMPPNASVLATYNTSNPNITINGDPAAVRVRSGKGYGTWMGFLAGAASQGAMRGAGRFSTPAVVGDFIREAIVNATGNDPDAFRAAFPVALACNATSPANSTASATLFPTTSPPTHSAINTSISGMEVRVIDAPLSSAVFVLNWTATGGFAKMAANVTGDLVQCQSVETLNVTFAAAPGITPSCIESVSTYDPMGPAQTLPFSTSATPTNKTTLVSFSIPKSYNVSTTLISYKEKCNR